MTDWYRRGIVAPAWGRGVAGLTRGPVKAETAGPNPVVPVRSTKQAYCKGFRSRLVCCSSPQSAPQQGLPFLTLWLANSVSQNHSAPSVSPIEGEQGSPLFLTLARQKTSPVGLWFHFSLPSTGLFHPADRNVPLVFPCLLEVQYPSGARLDSIRRGGRQA